MAKEFLFLFFVLVNGFAYSPLTDIKLYEETQKEEILYKYEHGTFSIKEGYLIQVIYGHKSERGDCVRGDKIQIRIFEDSKTYIGSEKVTIKNDIVNYINKYTKLAPEYYSSRNKTKRLQDVDLDPSNYKVVYELKNNRCYFYYLKGTIYYKGNWGITSTSKTAIGSESKSPLIEISINDKIVFYKRVMLYSKDRK